MYIYYLIYFIKLFIFVINCYFFENILLDEIKIMMMKWLIILQIKYYVYVYVELYCMGMYVKFVLY